MKPQALELAALYAERDRINTEIEALETHVLSSITEQRIRNANTQGEAFEALIAAETGVPDFLHDTTRRASHVEARALAYQLAHRAGWPLNQIAAWADRDHSTVSHSLRRHADLAPEADRLYRRIAGTAHAA